MHAWVGYTPRRRVKVAYGCGKRTLGGCGPRRIPGPTYGAINRGGGCISTPGK